MKRFLAMACCLSILGASTASDWRPATEGELKGIIPARAPVEKERIETEFRTASGITDGKANVFGVVLITAGYSADGKYSHYFVTQVPLLVGDLLLQPGNYVFGWQKDSDALRVKFYEAQSGKYLGAVEAPRNSRIGKIESFHIFAPSERAAVQIGRFAFPYKFVR
jgi:hypothetical protein